MVLQALQWRGIRVNVLPEALIEGCQLSEFVLRFLLAVYT